MITPEIKYIFWIIAIILMIPSQFFYIRSIIQGKTKPHIYSKIIFFIIMWLWFIIQYKNWWWFGSIILWIGALLEFITFLLALKYWRSDITKFDTYILFLALICIPVYLYSNNAYFILFLIILIDILWMIPTIRKTISSPYSEDLISWNISTIKHIFSIIALSNSQYFKEF